jgi:hypothetical protein
MIRMKYILQNMNVLNGLLAIAAVAMVYCLVIPFFDPVIRFSLPAVKETTDGSYKASASPQKASQADYAVIGDQNLFHPERIVPPEKKEEKAVPRPDVILYGTLITDQLSIAFVEDRKAPKTTPGRGKRQMTLHKGDHLGGYIVRDIEANRMVLVKGEEKIIVLLEDGEKRKATETSISPATAGMMPGGPHPTTFPASSSLPLQAPAQKVAPTAPASSHTVASPGPAGLDNTPSWPSSRRGKLEEVQKRKAERQTAAP